MSEKNKPPPWTDEEIRADAEDNLNNTSQIARGLARTVLSLLKRSIADRVEIERLRYGIKHIASYVRSRHTLYLGMTSGPMIRPKPGVAEAYDEAALFAETEAFRVLTNDQSGTVVMGKPVS